jgi:hypothetical protein
VSLHCENDATFTAACFALRNIKPEAPAPNVSNWPDFMAYLTPKNWIPTERVEAGGTVALRRA